MRVLHPKTVGAAIFATLCAGCGTSSDRPDIIENTDAAFPDGAISDDAGPDVASDSAPVDAGVASITPGAADRILLIGTVVTPDTSYEGQVLVEQDKITCAQPGTACAGKPGANGATIIDTQGVIAPGMIDTHNHILFDAFDGDDWLPMQTYMDHTQWTGEVKYGAMLDVKQCLANDSQGKPSWCLANTTLGTKYGNAAGSLRCELDKWGELKGMIAGTTSIVGLPGTSAACFGSLSRSIDVSQNDLGSDTVQTSAIFPPSTASGDGVCANFTSGTTKAYLIHCGEGLDAKALGEFSTLNTLTTTDGCLLAPQTTITHGTAFTATEFATMAQKGVKLTWSPASNVALYGDTANIPLALTAGVLIALAPDWSMGGSQNLLDELRFADSWDNTKFADKLTAQDLIKMVTTNAAKVVGYDDRIGSITEGYIADIVVVAGDRTRPFDAIVAARPKDVRITMIGGKVLFGDANLKSAGPAAPGCEDIDVCASAKFICVAEATATDKLDQTFAQIKTTLDTAMTDVDTSSGSAFKFAPLAPLVKCN
jgi:cytosine/adenosine deaminase-related metal-dependent hydrolase